MSFLLVPGLQAATVGFGEGISLLCQGAPVAIASPAKAVKPRRLPQWMPPSLQGEAADSGYG